MEEFPLISLVLFLHEIQSIGIYYDLLQTYYDLLFSYRSLCPLQLDLLTCAFLVLVLTHGVVVGDNNNISPYYSCL